MVQAPGHQAAVDPEGERTYLRCDSNDSFEGESNRLGHQVSGEEQDDRVANGDSHLQVDE